MSLRLSAAIAIAASLLSVAATAQTSASPPKTSEEPEVTRITIESSTIDIPWTKDRHVSERTLELPANSAWQAYPAVFSDLGIDPNIVDGNQMIFGSAADHRHTLAKTRISHYFDCGNMLGVSTADSYEIWIRVISQIIPIDNGLSTVRTQVEATARASDLQGGGVRCSSNGLLESRIAELLVKEAAKLPR
jgi:hypothetical protein